MQEYKKEYLEEIRNSRDSKDYRHYFVKRKHGKGQEDVLKGGRLSCAFFVSSVLFKFGWIDKTHCTTKRTVETMLNYGWKEIDISDIKKGDVILWEKRNQGHDGGRFHIGFYVGNKKAISNSWYKLSPWKHSYNYNNRRQILKIFTLIE